MNKFTSASRQMLRKVPEITVYFWIIKLLTTALGESTSDYLVNRFNPYVVVVLGFVSFSIALGVQLAARKYNAGIYWLTVVMVAIFGTMAADVMHVGLHIPYIISSVSFAIILAIIFIVWNKSEKTLSIHSITTSKRELFYWATVLATFALGTATGDLTAYTMHLGYLASGILFAAVFVVPALAYWLLNLNPILTFWFAYILTRPLGASFADWTGKSHSFGGLGLGDAPVSSVLAIFIVGLVAYLSITRRDIKIGKANNSYDITGE